MPRSLVGIRFGLGRTSLVASTGPSLLFLATRLFSSEHRESILHSLDVIVGYLVVFVAAAVVLSILIARSDRRWWRHGIRLLLLLLLLLLSKS